jgi:hypothetical protein
MLSKDPVPQFRAHSRVGQTRSADLQGWWSSANSFSPAGYHAADARKHSCAEIRMASDRRATYIKALAAKFIKLVESLEPGERLSITKISAPKKRRPTGKKASKSRPKRLKKVSD